MPKLEARWELAGGIPITRSREVRGGDVVKDGSFPYDLDSQAVVVNSTSTRIRVLEVGGDGEIHSIGGQEGLTIDRTVGRRFGGLVRHIIRATREV